MPAVVERTVYRWTELSTEVQQNVAYQEGRFHDYEHGAIRNIIEGHLAKHGLDSSLEASWAVSFCQGDGVAFRGSFDGSDVIDSELLVDCWAGVPKRTTTHDLIPEDLRVSVTDHHQFATAMTVECSYSSWEGSDEWNEDPRAPTDDELYEIAERFTEALKTIAAAAYDEASSWCLSDDRFSDPEICDRFEDDWFDEDGRITDGPD